MFLKNQYRDEINYIFRESEPENHFSADIFNERLISVWKAANAEGLSQEIFYEIIEEVMPEHLNEIVFPFKKAA